VLAAGAAAAAGALGGVWTAFARAAWLGLAAAAAVTAGGWKAGRALAGAALLAGALVVALHSGTRARLASAFDLAGNSDRVRIWRVGLAVAAEHPWTGVGFGRYPAVAGARPDAPPNLDWAHNQPLTLLAETGVAGLLAAAYLAAAALWALWRRSRSTEGTPERRALAAGGLASAVTLAAVSLFHDPLFEMPVVYAAAFLTALALFPGPTAAPPGPA
jgi:O-antigen ligase